MRNLAAGDQADVRRRPAHVEGDRVLESGRACDARRADGARGRTGDERKGRMRGCLIELDDTSRRPHYERHRQPRGHAALRKRAQVARHNRAEVRIDRRRRRSLVLAELGRDLVRRNDVRLRQPTAYLGCDRALVRGVPVRVEEADRHRLRVDLGQRVELERR